MAKRIVPSPETLRDLLRYEPETGRLYWKARPREMFGTEHHWKTWNTRFADKEAMTANTLGYLCGNINYVRHQAHRVAWAIYYGEWPEGDIDHINLIRSDNRISNLRLATKSENLRNIRRFSSNTSGYKGVSLHKKTGRWVARISTGTKYKHLGLFDDKEDARAAYMDAARKHHGEFLNYG